MEVTARPGDITYRKSDDNCDAKTKHNIALHSHVPSGSSQQVLPLACRIAQITLVCSSLFNASSKMITFKI